MNDIKNWIKNQMSRAHYKVAEFVMWLVKPILSQLIAEIYSNHRNLKDRLDNKQE